MEHLFHYRDVFIGYDKRGLPASHVSFYVPPGKLSFNEGDTVRISYGLRAVDYIVMEIAPHGYLYRVECKQKELKDAVDEITKKWPDWKRKLWLGWKGIKEMPDVNYSHEFDPSRKGICKQIVGGKKRGYEICGLPEDAPVHKRWEEKQRKLALEKIEEWRGLTPEERRERIMEQLLGKF